MLYAYVAMAVTVAGVYVWWRRIPMPVGALGDADIRQYVASFQGHAGNAMLERARKWAEFSLEAKAPWPWRQNASPATTAWVRKHLDGAKS